MSPPFTNKGITAAPVIDDAGHPIGVLSRSDLLVHQCETVAHPSGSPGYYHDVSLNAPARSPMGDETTAVAELMTPAVFSVAPDTPVRRVVEEMLALRVHRMFVVDEGGFLVGVISPMDVLRNLE